GRHRHVDISHYLQHDNACQYRAGFISDYLLWMADRSSRAHDVKENVIHQNRPLSFIAPWTSSNAPFQGTALQIHETWLPVTMLLVHPCSIHGPHLIAVDHYRPGTHYKSCRFENVLTQQSNHHSLALVKLAEILLLPICPAF
ncbi:hypothetical protein ATANTOWER_017147, partial [Ataeniobius toweri]|nr:hypothetical protein [Ataeniobius toweri]